MGCFYTDEKENKEKRENSICNENEPVTTALLLAAGTGSRLYPLTQDMPKCLTVVNEISILERLIDCLNQQGFKRLVVVTGHLENRIREFLGNRVGDMIIEYIHSPLYKTTNNIYSLWMAREFINEPFLLIESDLVFHASLLDELLYPDRIAVSRMQPWMNGSTVTLDQFDQVDAFHNGAPYPADEIRYKTVNIYSLSLSSWHGISKRLDQYISAGRVSDFYEIVFAEMVADRRLALQAVHFDDKLWYEIDTIADIAEAEKLFLAGKSEATIPHKTSIDTSVISGRFLQKPGGMERNMDSISTPVSLLGIGQSHKSNIQNQGAGKKIYRQETSMTKADYVTQTQKYEFISGQHGGYHRHDFIDHAYLYNLYFPPEAVFDNFKDQIHDIVLNYPVAQDALAGFIGSLIHQPSERIVVGNGASELIKIVSGQIARKLIIPVPSFNEYANAAPAGRVVEYALEFPSFQLDVDKFATAAIKAEADVAIVVTPNNPTSMVVPRSELLRLAQKLANHDCMLIVDESFIDFVHNRDQTTLEHEIEKYSNIAIFKSMSKAYGICGLRIGYMLTANSVFAEAVRSGVHIWNINGFAEEFLRLLPDYREEFIDSCEQVRKDRDQLYEVLSVVNGMTVYKPDANFIFCRLPDQAQSAPEITRRLFVEHDMYVKHCQGKSLPESDRYLRIASRTQTENRNLVAALVDIIGKK